MPILSSDILVRLSGGSSNSDPLLSIGGGASSVTVGTGLHALFDVVLSGVSEAGGIDYRCVYVKNNHGSLYLYNAKAWISSNTPSDKTSVRIAVGLSGVNGTETAVSSPSVSPGASFSSGSTMATGISLGDIPPGGHRAIWIERSVTAGAGSYTGDGATIAIGGDTGA